MAVKITRVWAMPNKWTFQIPPIAELLARYVGDGKGWIDPFAGKSTFAEHSNDINQNLPTEYHLPAIQFCDLFPQCEGAIFDPPYSSYQTKICYDILGYKPSCPQNDFLCAFDNIKDALAKSIKRGGCAISCGWNTNGLGRKRGFGKIEILLVAHGGHHNDTIVTVEQKVQSSLPVSASKGE